MHYRWEDFEKLDGERQSFIVAAYRTSNQIEAVISNDIKKKNAAKPKGAKK
jgi:hypothetical protein